VAVFTGWLYREGLMHPILVPTRFLFRVVTAKSDLTRRNAMRCRSFQPQIYKTIWADSHIDARIGHI
jgi:hypothetical protein